MFGSIQPRLWTPPLRELTPETSYGFDVIDFARDVLGTPLDPWEEWAVIHGGELLEDGRPRFRQLLVLVSRQNGKTFLCTVLSLYWLFVECQPLVLSTSTNLVVAKEPWSAACDMAQSSRYLKPHVKAVRSTNGQEELVTTEGSRYKIAASNSRGGRGLTINRLILDELREHRTWDAWNASVNATNAVADAQIWAISNQGDDESIVLDAMRKPALEFIETGTGDYRLGLFEWSAPDGAKPTDVEALALANPNLGYRTHIDNLLGTAERAWTAGGEELASFKTENMCIRVKQLNPAVDPDRWRLCESEAVVKLSDHRRNLALCVDVALDGRHATLVGAAVIDGKTYVEVIKQWSGGSATKRLREELPDLVARVKPRTLGWFPQGPAATVTAELQDRKGNRQWPPRGVEVAEIRGENAAVCMSFADLVRSDDVRHYDDPLLNLHVSNCQKMVRGDVWVFVRQGSDPIDAAYAAAGAVYLARTLPTAPQPLAVAV